ncbi:MAG: TetR family transcriptional regulator [Actinomycetota bacterium]|uniref:TetR family transcriptional regulator n=1 Tax=Mycobacterium lentiflavum TaxID=141349 RepID=A0ABY3UPJ9_MYCLN|nr:TetR/AcrR family transcriptional regulator [Mycobacterium lentiflavum]MEE3066825.1 TetR family transcriptional regulator [Actinomycetota bacterium]ULP40395.1 TetR family transcriptional regulator [Mycobacterium lentiflavum]
MPSELELDADQIVAAAVEIMREGGLDAISMRSVANRLGVTPPPVYSRIGNKDALIDAVAEHVLDDLAPELKRDESWPDYARRWTRQLRARLTDAADSRLFLQAKRPAYLKASRPLLKSMRRDGMSTDMSVRACRLLTWAAVGFVAMDHPPSTNSTRRRGRLAGSDPAGVTREEVDELFAAHIDYLIEGIRRDSA